MRWQGRRTSRNIEDRRGRRMTGGPAKLGGIGLLAVVLIGAFLGVDVTPFLGGGGMSPAPAPTGPNQIDDSSEEFVAVVLADTEEVWGEIFRNSNLQYMEPKLVLFTGRTSSACGLADAATGPFYCPNDQQVYLDTDFFRIMDTELGARGDFAKAYVVAHEVGHHVQNLLGTLEDSNRLRAQSSQAESNAISVRVELQADCYSGLWARAVQDQFGVLEPGDIEEALNTAARIGDDALQRASRGVVVPDSFTHGTSDQRQRWFAAGYQTGDPQACDTFSARGL
ncbi:KPN_02809 family neutral zinc metallopeptidase [Fluviibacterium sp. S390]|uniref:KPN_02809 family neutral zinc metallopeptidase n=1 Tax=Fluviibacterium sp. S390 TaxID=3415139 RepID=UPI003C7AF4D9